MRALSVQQPWAWAIVHGPKRVENRTWATAHRGPLLIHAAKSRCRLRGTDPAWWAAEGLSGLPDFDRLEYGALIGVAEVTACVRIGHLPPELHGLQFVGGPVCWLLRDPRPLPEPIPYRGGQLIFDVPDSLIPAGLR